MLLSLSKKSQTKIHTLTFSLRKPCSAGCPAWKERRPLGQNNETLTVRNTTSMDALHDATTTMAIYRNKILWHLTKHLIHSQKVWLASLHVQIRCLNFHSASQMSKASNNKGQKSDLALIRNMYWNAQIKRAQFLIQQRLIPCYLHIRSIIVICSTVAVTNSLAHYITPH